MTDDVSLDGRVLTVAENSGGEVDGDTRFHFSQDGDLVSARYEGGDVRLGYLVGVRDGADLVVRYTQVTSDGRTATGKSVDTIETLADGRVRIHEEWSWDSKQGGGTSVLEEVADD